MDCTTVVIIGGGLVTVYIVECMKEIGGKFKSRSRAVAESLQTQTALTFIYGS